MCSAHVKQYLPANFQLIEINKAILSDKKTLDSKTKKTKDEPKIQINKSNYRQFYEKNFEKLSFSVNIESDKIIAHNILEAFQKTQEDILEREYEVNYSGTTVCSAFILGHMLYCANVGDSRCVVARFDNDSKLKALQISRDHKPDDPEEKSRILSTGGRVESFKNEDDEDVGPPRVWLQEEDVPGLAMSRSIGDTIAAQVGVLHSPEIHVYKFTKNDKFLIIASDGIWEFVTNEHAVQIVTKFWMNGDADSAVDELIKVASQFWEDVIILFIQERISKR